MEGALTIAKSNPLGTIKALLLATLLACGSAAGKPQAAGTALQPPTAGLGEGTLDRLANARVLVSDRGLSLQRIKSGAPIALHFLSCQAIGIRREAAQWWVLSTDFAPASISANHDLWILPQDPLSQQSAWHLELKGISATAVKDDSGITVSISDQALTLSRFEARPHSDPFGHRFSFQVNGGAALETALAQFYWGTMLPSVVEKTLAAHFPYSDGYVLSTLNVQSYAGSYPAVDHEFQIKGRLAMASELDLDVVRRMIELQFKLMEDDPEHLYRSPTSVQPDGRREYHIRRDSKDARENAAMFPLTGNIEVLEESWLFYLARKDTAWLRQNIVRLEHAAGWTLANIDQYGRVWSDVYYEDQVIKDGRETEAQAFSAHSFGLLANMERVLGRTAKAATYQQASAKIRSALVAPLPFGFWDAQHNRFVDWVDRNGKVHDHLPLLANTLPVTFGYATPAQIAAVQRLTRDADPEFERFPSFVAADIAAYTPSEMGTAGPYDLSAAGRYWYWDAAFRVSQRQNELLARQLESVAEEGRSSGYWMGERYDMDHVYFKDGKNAHGAEKYYEYPNVYAAVLITKALGLTIPVDAEISVAPQLSRSGEVQFDGSPYALRYTFTGKDFTLKNLAANPRRFKVDLSGLGKETTRYQQSGTSRSGLRFTLTLQPQQQAHWTASK